MIEDRYEGRQSSRELNQALYLEASNFINEVSSDLASMGYSIRIAGSLAAGKAIYMRGNEWYIKDIDFCLTKNGKALSANEARELREASWFRSAVKNFLRGLGNFYSENGISNSCNEADFIWDNSPFVPHVFAIGVNS